MILSTFQKRVISLLKVIGFLFIKFTILLYTFIKIEMINLTSERTRFFMGITFPPSFMRREIFQFLNKVNKEIPPYDWGLSSIHFNQIN